MSYEEFQRTADGLALYCKSWSPQGRAKGAIAFVHGLGEHIGRYSHVAERFTDAGYGFVGFDLPGHGRSKGNRGHTPPFEVLMKTIGDGIEEARNRFQGAPVFLYGHSLGGAFVLRYVIEKRPSLKGVIATSPSLGIPLPVPVLKRGLARIMYGLAPAFSMDNGLDLGGLSRDPEVALAAMKDPLYHRRISARLGWDLMRTWEWARLQHGEFPLPLLIMQGTSDIIVDPEATKRFAGAVHGDVTLKLWDGFYHELHNEPEKAEVLSFAIAWVEKHL